MQADALTCCLVECTGEDEDSCQKDVKVAPVLPTATTSCFLKEQGSAPEAEPTKIYSLEEWALIQQKEPNLLQCFLSWQCKPSSRECQR